MFGEMKVELLLGERIEKSETASRVLENITVIRRQEPLPDLIGISGGLEDLGDRRKAARITGTGEGDDDGDASFWKNMEEVDATENLITISIAIAIAIAIARNSR